MSNTRCHYCKQTVATVRMSGLRGIVVVEPGHRGDGTILARPVSGGDYVGGIAYRYTQPAGHVVLLPHRVVCEGVA